MKHGLSKEMWKDQTKPRSPLIAGEQKVFEVEEIKMTPDKKSIVCVVIDTVILFVSRMITEDHNKEGCTWYIIPACNSWEVETYRSSEIFHFFMWNQDHMKQWSIRTVRAVNVLLWIPTVTNFWMKCGETISSDGRTILEIDAQRSCFKGSKITNMQLNQFKFS